MKITLELPEDIAEGLESKWRDLPRVALESLALEAYRSRALTAARTASGVDRMTVQQVPRKEVRRTRRVQVWDTITCGARKRQHNLRHQRIGARETPRKRLESWS